MAVRSRVFWNASVPPGVFTVVYTCPLDRVALVRYAVVTNTPVAAAVFGITRNPAGGGAAAYIRRWQALAAGESGQVIATWALQEGDTVSVFNGAAAAITTYGSGSLLMGDAA